MRIGNKLYWYEMGRTGRTGKPQSCRESQRPLLRPGPFLIVQLMVNETRTQATRWESHTDFPWGHRFMPGTKTLARAFLLLLLPQAKILDTRGARADSKVDLGSRGSHGVNGCPGPGFDVKLQSWPWKRLPRRVSPTVGIAQPRGAAEPGAALLESSTGRSRSWSLAQTPASP